jgi:hypothetical protein
MAVANLRNCGGCGVHEGTVKTANSDGDSGEEKVS